MRFDAILFDLDGTLLSTLEDLHVSVNAAMAHFGYPLHTLDEVRSYVNNGARKLIERATPAGTDEGAVDQCLAFFQAHYKDNMANLTKPYPGVMEMLQTLKQMGVGTAVVSNKFHGAVAPLVKKYFGDLIGVSVGEHEADGVRRKPWPDTVNEALNALGVKRENALYVGDSSVDVETARNAGLALIAVTWGLRSRESLIEAGAINLIDRAEDFISEAEKL